jgi:GTP diphosphokinase / guanosine-3',5'-bis(diphosphate) 3'-diphosphatase
MVRLQDIIDQMRSFNADVNVDDIKKAYVFSAKIHQGQRRHSGEPYLIHPLSVAYIMAQLNLDVPSVVTGVLHDVFEEDLATPAEIEDLFGPTIRFLVEVVSKLSKVTFHTGEERQAENVRKMLVAMSQDLRVIFVKLADRLHNMRTLEYVASDKRESVSKETLEIYAPLANRLGIQWIRTELEDLAFRWLNPQQYSEISEKLERVKEERKKYIDDVLEQLRKAISENEVVAAVSGRLKHHYSIYRKMKQKHIDFDQVYDIIAFRIITENISDCYRMLGLIHAMWKPVLGRFKDYIAMPKINRYQSLHTTVIGPFGERVEIQIRTQDMHRIAEQGVAAHWAYKEGVRGDLQQNKDLSQFAWLRELLEQHKDVKDPNEFLENVKVDLFSDEVFAFTPQGDVKALPYGATALDFAYLVHTEVGHHCVGARINGKIAPLRQKLKNGDTVEILTNPNQSPSKDWLSFVKTAGAKNKIRAVIRSEQRERSQEIGREVLEKECKRRGINLQKIWKVGEVGNAAHALGYKNADEMLVALGYGKISTTKVMEQLTPVSPGEPKKEEIIVEPSLSTKIGQLFKRPAKKSKSGILVQGLDDIMVHFGKCCNPIPGDAIVGVITRGRGITVHTSACRRVGEADPERRIDVRWDMDQKITRTVLIRVHCGDRPGLMANMSNVLTDAGVNINQVSARVEDAGQAVCSFKVGILNLDQLHGIIQRLERIKGVTVVERVQG